MINPFEQKKSEPISMDMIAKPEPAKSGIKYDPNHRKPLKFEMEVPNDYHMINNHGTAIRRYPKVKGKKAVKQARRFRYMLKAAQDKRNAIESTTLLQPSPLLTTGNADESQ